MTEGYSAAKKYLKNTKANHVVVETHGSLVKGTLSLSNKDGLMTAKTVKNYEKLKVDSKHKAQLTALKQTAGLVAKGGDLIISSCTSACGADGKALAGAVKDVVGNGTNLYMSEAVTEGGVKSVLNKGFYNDYTDIEFGKNKIVYGKKYSDDYGNNHTNTKDEQFIKVGAGGTTKDVGNLQLNETGNNPVQFNKVETKKAVNNGNN